MKHNLYAVQDTLIGFGIPFIKANDAHAKRDYKEDLKTNPHAVDMRLYKIGYFDDETGELTPMIPEILEGGVLNE